MNVRNTFFFLFFFGFPEYMGGTLSFRGKACIFLCLALVDRAFVYYLYHPLSIIPANPFSAVARIEEVRLHYA